MNILGLVTARGGSKGIPRKNLALLAGEPLIAHTARAALESNRLTRVVLSTDDEEIAEAGRRAGLEVPFMRPAEFAQDTSTSMDVAIHALETLATRGWKADALLILQPTSPLRTSLHVREAVDRFLATDSDTLVSVTEVPHKYHPYSVMQERSGNLEMFWTEPLSFDRFRRQNLPLVWARNGPALLITKSNIILERRSFYGDSVVGYVMDERSSIDIDTPHDLAYANWLMSRGGTT